MIAIFGSGGAVGSALVQNFTGRHEFGSVVALTRADADLRSESDVSSLFARLASDFPPHEPWYIINCAATCHNGLIRKIPMQEWTEDVGSNLIGAAHIVKYASDYFRERPFSSITLLSSIVASRGVLGASSYGASKAGLSGLVRSVAPELAHCSGRINALELGYFSAGMISKVKKEHQEQLLRQIPLGRFGNLFELCHAVEFVARNTYLTGSVIPLTGGLA